MTIASPIWMAPMWKPTRAFAVSRLEVLFTDGAWPPDAVDGEPWITIEAVVAPDPSEGLGAGYDVICSTTLATPERRKVVDVPQPFGPRIIPAGWWLALCHDRPSWDADPDDQRAEISVLVHGCEV